MSRKYLVPALLLAVAALPALQGCKQEEAQVLPARPVLTMTVSPRIQLREGFAGTIEPRYQSDLSFRVIGRITERPVKVGDQVKKGQLLASIDPTQLDLAIRAATADMVSAKAQADNASAEEARRRTLYAQRNVSAETFEASQQARESTQASLLRARTALDKAREQRTYADLTAEYDAVVTGVFMEVGQTAVPGSPTVTIAQPDIRDAVIDVPDDFAPAVQIGAAFRIELQTQAAPPVYGIVREVAPQVDALTHTRRVKIAIKDPGRDYRLGTLVSAHLESGSEAKLRLPSTAILTRGEKTFVWIADASANQVREREVSVTPAEDGVVIVDQGLEAGTRVVVAGVNSLTSGQKVRILDQVTR